MPTISLTTFLKNLTKGTPQKVQEYSRYLAPGGYDFYWRLKDAAHALTVKGESFDECAKLTQKAKRDVERKHNLDCLKSLQKWMEKNKIEACFDAPSGAIQSPGKLVTIKLEPEFGLILNNVKRLVLLWNTSGSALNKTAASVGIHLLQQNLCSGAFVGCKAGILDLRKANLYVADAVPANIEAIVAGELAWLDGFFKSQENPAHVAEPAPAYSGAI